MFKTYGGHLSLKFKPHLHEQVFLDSFSLKSLFCSCRSGIFRKVTIFSLSSVLFQKLSCHFLTSLLVKEKLSRKIARVDTVVE